MWKVQVAFIGHREGSTHLHMKRLLLFVLLLYYYRLIQIQQIQWLIEMFNRAILFKLRANLCCTSSFKNFTVKFTPARSDWYLHKALQSQTSSYTIPTPFPFCACCVYLYLIVQFLLCRLEFAKLTSLQVKKQHLKICKARKNKLAASPHCSSVISDSSDMHSNVRSVIKATCAALDCDCDCDFDGFGWRASSLTKTVVPGPPFQKSNCPKMYADFKLKRVINNEKYITGSPIANLSWHSVEVAVAVDELNVFCFALLEWHFLNWSRHCNKCSANLLCYLINIINE